MPRSNTSSRPDRPRARIHTVPFEGAGRTAPPAHGAGSGYPHATRTDPRPPPSDAREPSGRGWPSPSQPVRQVARSDRRPPRLGAPGSRSRRHASPGWCGIHQRPARRVSRLGSPVIHETARREAVQADGLRVHSAKHARALAPLTPVHGLQLAMLYLTNPSRRATSGPYLRGDRPGRPDAPPAVAEAAAGGFSCAAVGILSGRREQWQGTSSQSY